MITQKVPIGRCGQGSTRKRTLTPPSNKMTVVSEECDETLDEITWGYDDSASPIMKFDAVIRSERFILGSPEKSSADQLKRRRLLAHRRRKKGVDEQKVKDDNISLYENIDMSDKVHIKMSPKCSTSDVVKQIKAPVCDVACTKKGNTMKIESKTLQLKMDQQVTVKSLKKQQSKPNIHLEDFSTVEPYTYTCSMKENDINNQWPEKLQDSSHKNKQRAKKLNKKRGHVLSIATSEKPLTSYETTNCSNSGEESLSSPVRAETQVDIIDQQHLCCNPSESSIVCRRDSWIWFSPETQPSAENFTQRQRKLRSQDPRVVALAAEIKRQEELNRDIERTAESLIDTSSSPSVGGAKKSKSRAGKYRACKNRVGRRSKLMPYSRVYKLPQINSSLISDHRYSYESVVKSRRAAKVGSSNVKTLSSNKLKNPAKAASEKSESKIKQWKSLPVKHGRKISAVTTSVDNNGGSSNSLDDPVDKEGDKTFSMNLLINKEELKGNKGYQVKDIKPRRYKDHSKIQGTDSGKLKSDHKTGLNQFASNELTKPKDLGYGFPQSPAHLKHSNSNIPELSSKPAYNYGLDENVLKHTPSSGDSFSNTQYLISCLEAQLLGTMMATASQEQLQSGTQNEVSDNGKVIPPTLDKRRNNTQSNPTCSQVNQETKKKKLVWSPVFHTNSVSKTQRHVSQKPYMKQKAKTGQKSVSKSQKTAKEKQVSNSSTNPSGEYSSWLKLCYNQLASKSNSISSKVNSDDIISDKSPHRSSSLESKLNDLASNIKLEHETSCIENLVNQEVNTAIHKLLFDSDRSQSSYSQHSVAGNHLHDFNDDNQIEVLLGNEKKNFTETMIVDSSQSQSLENDIREMNDENTAPSCNPTSSTANCLLNSFLSTCVSNSLPCQQLINAAKPKRTNIYTRNYYLGKRVTLKNKKEPVKTPIRPPDNSSLSRWKKTNITWSKTVSLHLYSPSTKPISPRTRRRQKHFEQEMKKLKPCLKVTHSLTEQSGTSLSFSDNSLGLCMRSVVSDSAITLKSEEENIHNHGKISSLPASNVKPHHENTNHTSMKRVNNVTDVCKTEKPCSLSVHKTKVNPVKPKCTSKTTDPSYRKSLDMPNTITTTSSCRKENSTRQGSNKPTVSKNNSSSTIPYRSYKAATSCRSRIPTRIAQLFFVTETEVGPQKISSQNEDNKILELSKQSQTGMSEAPHMLVKPLKTCSFLRNHVPFVNNDHNSNLAHKSDFRSQNKKKNDSFINALDCTNGLENMKETRSEFVLKKLFRRKSHPINTQSDVVGTPFKYKVTNIKHASDELCDRNHLSESEKTNSFSLDCLQDQNKHRQWQSSSKWKHYTLFVPSIVALPQTSSDEEESFQDSLNEDKECYPASETEFQGFVSSCNKDTTILNSLIANRQLEINTVSNQDSGFDESLTETTCFKHTSQQFPSDLTEFGPSPCWSKTTDGNEEELEMRCQSVLSHSDTSHVSEFAQSSVISNDCITKKSTASSVGGDTYSAVPSLVGKDICNVHKLAERYVCNHPSLVEKDISIVPTLMERNDCSVPTIVEKDDCSVSSLVLRDMGNVPSLVKRDICCISSSVGKEIDNVIPSLWRRDFETRIPSLIGRDTCITTSPQKNNTCNVPSLKEKDMFNIPLLVRMDTCNTSSLKVKDTCNIPILVGKDTCNIPSLQGKDICNIPVAAGIDTCNTSSLKGKDTSNITSLQGKDIFNIPVPVGIDTSCNTSSLKGKDTCDIPILVGKDTCNIPSLQGKDTCNIPVLVEKDTCNIPVLVEKDTCNIPILVGKDTCNIPSLQGKDTCNIPVLVGKNTCNIPILVGKDTSNITSLQGKDICNIPVPVGIDTCNTPSLKGKDTCNIPILVGKDSSNIPLLQGKDACNIPVLVGKNTCIAASLQRKDTSNIHTVVGRNTCYIPSLQRKDTCSVNSLVGKDLGGNDPLLEERNISSDPSLVRKKTRNVIPLLVDYDFTSGKNEKAQISESIDTIQNKLELTQDISNTGYRTSLEGKFPFNSFENISTFSQEQSLKKYKMAHKKRRNGLQNKRKFISSVNRTTLNPSSVNQCLSVCAKEEKEKCMPVAVSSAADIVSGIHTPVEMSHKITGETELSSGFSCLNCIAGRIKNVSAESCELSMSHKRDDMRYSEESPLYKDLIEYSLTSYVSKSEEEFINIPNSSSTGSDIACLSSLESLNAHQLRDVSHSSKSNSSLGVNLLFNELVFGETQVAKSSGIASLNFSEKFSNLQDNFSQSRNQLLAKKSHCQEITLVKVNADDDAHNVQLPPTSSDEEECQDCDHCHCTSIFSHEEMPAKCVPTVDKSQHHPHTPDKAKRVFSALYAKIDFPVNSECQTVHNSGFRTVHSAPVRKNRLIIPTRSVAFSELIKRF